MAKKHTFLSKKNVIITLAIFIAIFVISFSLSFNNRIFPNIYVSNIYLGGQTKDEAEKYFRDNFKLIDKISIEINGKQNSISTSEIILDLDYKNTIDRAYKYAHSGNIFSDFYSRFNLIFKPVNLASVVKIDEKKLLETLLIVSNSNDLKPVYPSAALVDNSVVIDLGKNGFDINFDKARFDIGNAINFRKNNKVILEMKAINVSLKESSAANFKQRAEKLKDKVVLLKSDDIETSLSPEVLLSFISPSGFYDDRIEAEVKKIAEKLNRNPQDSIFVVENKKVIEFAPSKNGVVVDEKELSKQLKNNLDELLNSQENVLTTQIPVITTKPKINNEDVNDLGIKSLIGSGFSNFKGSIPNRIHNVNLAQSKFKGVLIAPDEIVSFNDVLGDVSSFTGYKAAYVIKDGKTVLGDGGGVCQVSTTLFRAVLNAGLPVIERRAHAYRVGYYEQGFGPGLDATVYSPTTDFKFKNDTTSHILLQPTIDLNNLTLKFDIYGTSDGRVSNVSKPVITSSSAPAEDLYVDDPTLPVGTVKQIEHRAYGAKVVFDYKVTRNGEELINQKFVSNYRPWQAVYLRGVGL